MHMHAVMLTLAALGLQHVSCGSSGADLPQEASPQICVVVKTYAAHAHSLPVTLSGIFSDRDTRQHMRAIVVETDASAPFPNLPTLVDRLNVLIGFTGIIVSPRTSENVRGAFPRLKMNDYGYLASDATLEDLLFAWAAARWPGEDGCEVSLNGLQTECTGSGSVSRSMDHVIAPLPYATDAGLTCDALLVTNGDNVYASSMWSELLQALSSWRPPAPPAQLAVDAAGAPDPGPLQPPVRPGGAHLVATHWATHYEQPSHPKSYLQILGKAPHCGPLKGGIFSEIIASTEFIPGCVDLGAVAFRADLLARSGLRFYADLLMTHPTGERIKVPNARAKCSPNAAYCADGHFAHRAWRWAHDTLGVGSTVVVRMPLMLHR